MTTHTNPTSPAEAPPLPPRSSPLRRYGIEPDIGARRFSPTVGRAVATYLEETKRARMA